MFGQSKSYGMDSGEVSSSAGNHSIIEPIFAQWMQSAHGKTSYRFEVLLSSMKGPVINAG